MALAKHRVLRYQARLPQQLLLPNHPHLSNDKKQCGPPLEGGHRRLGLRGLCPQQGTFCGTDIPVNTQVAEHREDA